MLSLGIGIPVYYPHHIYINTLLDTISKSSVLPNEVCMSISSCPTDDYIKIEREYPFSVNIFQTKEPKNSSENRNIVADMLTTDIISFIDADDLPHVDRNKILMICFSHPEINAVTHDYMTTKNRFHPFIYCPIEYPKIYENYINTIRPDCVYAVSDVKHYDYHAGHITVRKHIINKHKYIEDWSRVAWMEDSIYTQQLVNDNIPITYVNEKLSLYYH
jgi:glycosyltransferase involved in cell wall biosynthesis